MAKIAFVWWFDKAKLVFPNWRDGLRAAIEEIEKKHEVTWFLGKDLPEDPYAFDGIIVWDDSNTEAYDKMFGYKDKFPVKIGLCLTTDPYNFDNLRNFDVVYCESIPVYNAVRSQGIRAIKAFGTDIDFFKPNPEVKKDMEYFYPATFSPWKLQSKIAYLGNKLTCIGTIQPDGQRELDECLKNGVNVEEGYFPPEKIKEYYWRSKKVIIPAIHGSERTILEAMACNILPEVTNEDNIRAQSYIREYHLSGAASPRDFVEKNYSHKKYAKDIMKGLQ